MGRQLHEDLPLGSYPDRPSVNQPTSKSTQTSSTSVMDK